MTSTTPDAAGSMLEDLLVAAQGFGTRSLRGCVAEVFQALTGEKPSEQRLADILGEDWPMSTEPTTPVLVDAQPIYWLVAWTHSGVMQHTLAFAEDQASDYASRWGGSVTPLYAAPPAPAVLAEGEREAIASLIYKAHGQVYERRPFSGGAPIPFADLINRKRRGFLATADAVLALLRPAPSLPTEESVSTHEAARAHALLDRFKHFHGFGVSRQAPSGHGNDLVSRIQWALTDAEAALKIERERAGQMPMGESGEGAARAPVLDVVPSMVTASTPGATSSFGVRPWTAPCSPSGCTGTGAGSPAT